MIRKLDVIVAGGGGQTRLDISGDVLRVAVLPPQGATYDIEFVTLEDYGAWGTVGLSGRATVDIKDYFDEIMLVTISNASLDGEYGIRIWLR